MTCAECGRPFGEFDRFVAVYQRGLRFDGSVLSPEHVGYVHLRHLTNT